MNKSWENFQEVRFALCVLMMMTTRLFNEAEFACMIKLLRVYEMKVGVMEMRIILLFNLYLEK